MSAGAPVIKNLPEQNSVTPRVEAALTRLLYQAAPFGLLSNLGLGAVLATGVWSYFSPRRILGWMAVILAVTIARWLLARAFSRRDIPDDAMPRWRTLFFIGTVAAGGVWGLAAWLFLSTQALLPLSLTIFLIAGLNAGAVRSLASVPGCYLAYAFTSLLPVMARFFSLHENGSLMMAISTLMFILFLMKSAHQQHEDQRGLYQLRFENEALVITSDEARLRAESINRSKSEFLATMSHEIRTPMNGIIGMLQLIRSSPLEPAQKEQIEIATRSADALLHLLNDILDFSKIESGKLDFEAAAFSPAEIMRDIATLFLPQAEAKGLAFVCTLDPGLPEAVTGDALRLRQVLLNLAGNAIKFTPHGRVEIALSPCPPQPDGILRLRFTVRDTGIGMDEFTKTRLFQKFSQGDNSTTRRYGGTGLGLAISQHLIRQMGGEIGVRSQPGAGSEFFFTLALPAAAPAPAPAAPVAPPPAPFVFKGCVLVAEDDAVNQRVIEMMLKNAGLDFVVVTNGLDVVELATAGEWSLILMDMRMPGIDGPEATRRIREKLAGRPLPIIALTANAMPEDRAACFAAGMDDFLTKPIRQPQLLACLKRWLNLPAA